MKQRYSNLKSGNSFLKNYIHLIFKWMKGIYESLLEKNALSIFKKIGQNDPWTLEEMKLNLQILLVSKTS